MNHIIFDFDGVMARSLEDNATIHLNFKINSGITLEEIIAENQEHFDQPKHHRLSKISESEERYILNWSKDYGNKVLSSNNHIFWDFIYSIKKLKNCRFAIVSSGSELYVKHFAGQFGIKFDETLTIEDSLSKEEKVEQVCRNWNIDVKDSYYITDTVSDVLELREIMNPTRIYGCAWGWSGLERLRNVLPNNQIFIEFSDILKYF
jgi:phosphoserine phosphatase